MRAHDRRSTPSISVSLPLLLRHLSAFPRHLMQAWVSVDQHFVLDKADDSTFWPFFCWGAVPVNK